MTLNRSLQKIVEHRGVRELVAAKILTDNNETGEGLTYGPVFSVAGVAEVSKAVEQGAEAHFYDNIPAIVIDSEGPDTIAINASALPLDVKAELTGQTYLADVGAMVEGDGDKPYFAVGYITSKTDGTDVYVWRYKGKFVMGDLVNTTKDNSTNANGQTLTYTGINTTHKFTRTGKTAKGLVVDSGLDLADVTAFHDTVTTPDTVTAKN